MPAAVKHHLNGTLKIGAKALLQTDDGVLIGIQKSTSRRKSRCL
jgi:hypothetical protein